jgi:hypothetical protein
MHQLGRGDPRRELHDAALEQAMRLLPRHGLPFVARNGESVMALVGHASNRRDWAPVYSRARWRARSSGKAVIRIVGIDSPDIVSRLWSSNPVISAICTSAIKQDTRRRRFEFRRSSARAERHCNVVQRPHEARQSLSDRAIVVDDRYDGCPSQFRFLNSNRNDAPSGHALCTRVGRPQRTDRPGQRLTAIILGYAGQTSERLSRFTMSAPRRCRPAAPLFRALRGLSDRQRQAKDRAAGLVRRCR